MGLGLTFSSSEGRQVSSRAKESAAVTAFLWVLLHLASVCPIAERIAAGQGSLPASCGFLPHSRVCLLLSLMLCCGLQSVHSGRASTGHRCRSCPPKGRQGPVNPLAPFDHLRGGGGDPGPGGAGVGVTAGALSWQCSGHGWLCPCLWRAHGALATLGLHVGDCRVGLWGAGRACASHVVAVRQGQGHPMRLLPVGCLTMGTANFRAP